MSLLRPAAGTDRPSRDFGPNRRCSASSNAVTRNTPFAPAPVTATRISRPRFDTNTPTGESATSACRVIAPITIERPRSSMPDRPSIKDRSIRLAGLASRCFMVGIRVWPPASSFASSPLASRFAACRTLDGRCNVNAYIEASLFRRFAGGVAALDRGPDRLRGRRHGDLLAADRVGDGVDDRGGRGDGAGLAAAFDAERVRRAFRHRHADLERGHVVRARHAIIHERAGHELAVLVIDRAFEQRLADPLRDPAVDLTLDDHRIDEDAEIVD